MPCCSHSCRGDCTQVQFCTDGGYMMPIPGGSANCAHVCDPSSTSLSSLNATGFWPDVVYDDKTNSEWKPTLHLERALAMARAWRCPACGSQQGDSKLLAGIHRALTAWLSLNNAGPQWWWQDIGSAC